MTDVPSAAFRVLFLGFAVVSIVGAVFASIMVLRARCVASLDRWRPAVRLPLVAFLMSLEVKGGVALVLYTINELRAPVFSWPWVAMLLVMTLIWWFPLPLARAVCVPRGAYMVAYHLALLSHWSFWSDRRGGAVAIGAWSLMRVRRSDQAEAVAWLEQQLSCSLRREMSGPHGVELWLARVFRVPTRGRTHAMVAAGFLSAVRGDLSGARHLLAHAEQQEDSAISGETLRLARAWRRADAVESGDWVRVRRLCAEEGARPSAEVRFLAAVAERMCGDASAPDDQTLTALSRGCRARDRLAPLLHRACAVPRGVPPEVAAPAAPLTHDPLEQVLRVHLHLCRTAETASAAALADLGRCWAATLEDEATRSSLRQRAHDLGAPSPPATLLDLSRQVGEQVAALAACAQVPLDSLGGAAPLVRTAGQAHVGRAMVALKTTASALSTRVETDRRLPGETERREIASLTRQYFECAELGGPTVRAKAFHLLHEPVSSYAVWLHNRRRQRRIANEVFRFLMLQACVVGDADATLLHGRNASLGEPS